MPTLSKNFSVNKSPRRPGLPIQKVIHKDKLPPKIRIVGVRMAFFETAVAIVEHCSKGRIPEALLQVHRLAKNEYVLQTK